MGFNCVPITQNVPRHQCDAFSNYLRQYGIANLLQRVREPEMVYARSPEVRIPVNLEQSIASPDGMDNPSLVRNVLLTLDQLVIAVDLFEKSSLRHHIFQNPYSRAR